MTESVENTDSERERGIAKVREGLVLSTKMDKTIVVAIQQRVKHKYYGKYYKRTRKYYAHDADNSCGEGDLVKIVETRPLSKLKRWRVQEIVRKAL